MTTGRLITIEGIDGAGKTTLAKSLSDALRRHRIDIRVLREPGGVAAAERIRELVTQPGLEIGARTEALLYAAARAQLLEQAVEPLLASGAWVLLDRFVDSSLAYQGGGRQLGLEPVASINRFATHGRRPDRTLLLVVDPTVGRARWQARSALGDRLEGEDEGFFARVSAAYEALSRADPDRVRRIDAGQSAGKVLSDALAALSDLIADSRRDAPK